MSGTSGNIAFDILGAGTATFSAALYHALGIDNNTPTNAAAQTGSFSAAAQSVASVVLGSTGTAMAFSLRGMFRVSGGGTIIPSCTLVTAIAAVVQAGSYFKCHRVGSGTVETVGEWS